MVWLETYTIDSEGEEAGCGFYGINYLTDALEDIRRVISGVMRPEAKKVGLCYWILKPGDEVPIPRILKEWDRKTPQRI